ncbi:retrovirus-related pol polyprotein from transposon TNT 1-94 [Tanacetum coccineum]
MITSPSLPLPGTVVRNPKKKGNITMAITSAFTTVDKTAHNSRKFAFTISPANYGYWKTMIEPFLITNNLMDYVDGSIPCPSKTLSVTDCVSVSKENPNYPIWVSNDANVRMLIISTISEASFRHVQGTTSRDLWLSLKKSYAPHSTSRKYILKTQLLRIKMHRDETLDAYLNRAQEYADALATIGEPVKDKDLVMIVVSCLREEYNGLKTTITTRQSPTAFSELHALPSDYDYMLEKNSCGIGHIPSQCLNCDPSTIRTRPSANFANTRAQSSNASANWYSDTRANSHVTPDLEAMDNSEAYYGDDALHVGNSKGLPILHIGSSKVYSPEKTFSLKNILHVPEISHNLLSVQNFCHDNDVFFEFHTSYFVVKDESTHTTLLTVLSKHGLYTITLPQLKSINKNVQTDWGGEFRNLALFFSSLGIIHRRSCLHTSEQNGFVERRNRHVVETGITLLAQACVPQRFWHYAFDTTIYLINRMPSRTSTHKSPFEHIFKRSPDYSFLRVFGCLCFPPLRPYNHHKMDFCSTPCVFLGYSPSHYGYRCLDISTERIYIARHVHFNEAQFAFDIPKTTSSVPSKTSPYYSSESPYVIPTTDHLSPSSPRSPISSPSSVSHLSPTSQTSPESSNGQPSPTRRGGEGFRDAVEIEDEDVEDEGGGDSDEEKVCEDEVFNCDAFAGFAVFRCGGGGEEGAAVG